MLKWVQVKKFCEISGYTPDAIYAKMKKGVWLEGAHWRKGPDGHIFINLQEFEKWVEGRQFPPVSKSAAQASG